MLGCYDFTVIRKETSVLNEKRRKRNVKDTSITSYLVVQRCHIRGSADGKLGLPPEVKNRSTCDDIRSENKSKVILDSQKH